MADGGNQWLDAARGALEVAREAGALLLSRWRSPAARVVRHKGRVDLVTEQDLASERLVRRALAARFPGHAIVAEEEDGPAAGTGRAGEREALCWWVDPLDGTTNYAHGHPFFSVSLGLMRGSELLAAVIVAPALGLEWHGARGAGAYRNGERCRVSEVERLEDALLATGFPYDRRTRPDDNLRRFAHVEKHECQGIRRCGSAAIDLAFVADGTYDGYWEHGLNGWDMAAGALLVLEAGGRLTDLDGGAPDPRTGRLVATNGRVHDALLDALARASDSPAP
ncbi:MAG: inositol monophosphatase [Myxococcota bacterium]|nr:inositol monophosphatase [Myxococcota bacterium]MDW8361753.1 inositol monophosphatase family protein [Myxococcales bacterium]